MTTPGATYSDGRYDRAHVRPHHHRAVDTERYRDGVEAEGLIAHDVLAVVLRITGSVPSVLLWQRAREPDLGRWALPGGRLGAAEDVEASVRRHLAEKVDLAEVAHVEQLAVFSDPHRGPAPRRVATAFLGLVPSDADPAVPADTAWHRVDALPPTAFDHGEITRVGLDRLRAKLSYTNIGFALAPDVFSISELRRLYAAALGHHVSATNLQRVLHPARRPRPHRLHRGARTGGRASRGALPLLRARTAGHRPVRGAAPAVGGRRRLSGAGACAA